MRLAIDVLLDYSLPTSDDPTDVLLQIEAAAMADQRIVSERLTATSPERLRAVRVASTEEKLLPLLRERLAGYTAPELSALFEARGLPFART